MIRRLLLAMLLLPAFASAQDGGVALNITIPVFGTGVTDDSSAYAEFGVFPRIRAIEAQFLPFPLRRQLAATGTWGAVRVADDVDAIEELVIHGDILRSDGRGLEVHIRAVDASGDTWLDERFSAAPGSDSARPAYERLFADVVARLEAARQSRSADALARLRDTALLRYGARLAPSTFSQYIETTRDGRTTVRRLPANNDPMLDRIRRIRDAEYVIVDATDEKYELLHADVTTIYGVWREFNRQSLLYEASDERRIANGTVPGERGSYEALLYAYENYKYSRITAEERDDMAVAFDNEVRPIIERLDERLEAYDAWREAKYSEWNRLLEELHDVETRFGE